MNKTTEIITTKNENADVYMLHSHAILYERKISHASAHELTSSIMLNGRQFTAEQYKLCNDNY